METNESTPMLLPEDSPEDDSSVLDVMADLGENEDDAKVKVYRATPGKRGNDAYLFECLPSEFSLDFLRDNYGGGHFRVQIRVRGRIYRQNVISIEAPKTPTLPAVVSPAPQLNAPVSQNLDLLTFMREMQNRQLEAQQQMLAGFSAIVERISGTQNSRADYLQEMLTMKQIFAQPAQNSDPISTLMQGIQLAREVGIAEKPETNMFEEMAKTILPALTQLPRNNSVPVQQPQIAAPVQHQQIPLNQTPDTESEEMKTPEFMIRNYLKTLCAQAARGASAESWAYVVDEYAPISTLREHSGETEKEKIVAKLAEIYPQVNDHKTWFVELLGVLEEIEKSETFPPANQT